MVGRWIITIEIKGQLSKERLREEFSKNANLYYKVNIFEEEGFTRKQCKICKKYFWSIGEREVCEDSSHTEYTFFKKKPVDIGYTEFWSKFAEFFKKNGHAEIKKYPVVSRWRKDLYFTIASIQDFQRIEAGEMGFEYSANPLIVPQICLRFGDIENVGVTGRHFTGFMMAGQHSFNYPKEGYWKDRCIELNFNFFTKVLGVKKEELVYSEDVWAMPDFSEFGPCLETFSNGAELVNSVFTQFELANGATRELEGKVVDVGWGFDRLLWFYTGYDNAYEAVFHSVLEKVRKKTGKDFETEPFKKFAKVAGELDVDVMKNARERELQLLKKVGLSEKEYQTKVRPLQGLYAVFDHARTLLFAISDGALPSNIGGGYNLRIILRRSLDFIERYGLGIDLPTIAKMIADELNPLYPELSESLEDKTFDSVIEIERERYWKSRESAKQLVSNIISKGREIDMKQLKTLYESNGITPEFLANAASSKGVELKLPENIYENLIEGDLVKSKKQPKQELNLPAGLKPTGQLYYKFMTDAKPKVIFTQGKYVVLDETPFYPEGGGQAPDRGTINGIKVIDVQKYAGDVIVHTLEKDPDFKVGSAVTASVDKDARMRLTAHHTATHLISAASRKFLGRHAWQEGTRKEPEKAHIDIAHYDKLDASQLGEIEAIVNRWLFNGIKVEANYIPRGEAEAKYGFEIYQGHGVPSKTMRIVTIMDKQGNLIDAQACGGLHAINQESILGLVKIINSYRSHDGIVRIEFVAGPSALDYFRNEDLELHEVSRLLNAELFKVHEKVIEIKEEQQASYDLIKDYINVMAEVMAESLKGEKVVERQIDLPREVMRKIADKMIKSDYSKIVLFKNSQNEVICIAGEKSNKSAISFIRDRSNGKKFIGGGSDRYAEGRLA
ncbi:MAG: alanine--tRNA ligase [Candidatus Micrarchaeaceae archaeon]